MVNVKDFVRRWNYRFPVDYWWRKKHEVFFNSPEHRNSNFWDQFFEYEEDKMYELLRQKKEYEPNEDDWLNIKEEEEDVSVEERIEDAMLELQKFKKDLNK